MEKWRLYIMYALFLVILSDLLAFTNLPFISVHMLNRIKRTQSKQKYEQFSFLSLNVWLDILSQKLKFRKFSILILKIPQKIRT